MLQNYSKQRTDGKQKQALPPYTREMDLSEIATTCVRAEITDFAVRIEQ